MKKIIALSLILITTGCNNVPNANEMNDFYNEEPVINLIGENEITLNYCQKYVENGFQAFFNETDITGTVEVSDQPDTCVSGTHEIEYYVKYNDKEVTVIRYIKVLEDSGVTLNLTGKKEVSIELGQNYVDSGIVAYDNHTNEYVTSSVLTTGEVDNMSIGTYTIYYSITVRDVEYTTSRIVIVANISSITISLVGKQYSTMSIYDSYVELGATASSKYLDLTEYLTIENNISLYNSGVYTVSYNVEYSGVSSTKIRTVEITTPVVTFELNGVENTYLMKSESYLESGFVANDSTNKVDISSYVEDSIEFISTNEYIITYVLEYDNTLYTLYRYVLKLKYESIRTTEDFLTMDMDTDYILFNDIDFTDVDLTEFITDSKDYNGELNGNGYSFLNINITSEEDITLFNSINNKVHNITFDNINLSSSSNISLISKNCYGTLDNITLSNVTINTLNFYGICKNIDSAEISNIHIYGLFVEQAFKYMPLFANSTDSTYINIVVELILYTEMFTILEDNTTTDVYEGVHIIIDDYSIVMTVVTTEFENTVINVYSNNDLYCNDCTLESYLFYDEENIANIVSNDLWSFDIINNFYLKHVKEYN